MAKEATSGQRIHRILFVYALKSDENRMRAIILDVSDALLKKDNIISQAFNMVSEMKKDGPQKYCDIDNMEDMLETREFVCSEVFTGDGEGEGGGGGEMDLTRRLRDYRNAFIKTIVGDRNVVPITVEVYQTEFSIVALTRYINLRAYTEIDAYGVEKNSEEYTEFCRWIERLALGRGEDGRSCGQRLSLDDKLATAYTGNRLCI